MTSKITKGEVVKAFGNMQKNCLWLLSSKGTIIVAKSFSSGGEWECGTPDNVTLSFEILDEKWVL